MYEQRSPRNDITFLKQLLFICAVEILGLKTYLFEFLYGHDKLTSVGLIYWYFPSFKKCQDTCEQFFMLQGKCKFFRITLKHKHFMILHISNQIV